MRFQGTSDQIAEPPSNRPHRGPRPPSPRGRSPRRTQHEVSHHRAGQAPSSSRPGPSLDPIVAKALKDLATRLSNLEARVTAMEGEQTSEDEEEDTQRPRSPVSQTSAEEPLRYAGPGAHWKMPNLNKHSIKKIPLNYINRFKPIQTIPKGAPGPPPAGRIKSSPERGKKCRGRYKYPTGTR